MSDDLRDLIQANPDQGEAALAAVKKSIFVPHGGGQADVLADLHRFQVVAAGRRWGKTKVAARRMIREAVSKPDSMNWWIANSYRNVRRGYREVVRQIPPQMLAKPAPMSTSNELILTLKGGQLIEFYSGGNPDALAGEGNDFVVVDEAGLIADSVWYQLIRPTLMDKKGKALIISTPRGRNWFWKMFNQGQAAAAKEHMSWCFPQSANPFIDPEETASAKRELPELLYRQEIMAEFLASGASIFGIGLQRPGAILDNVWEPEGDVFFGIDLAKQYDFTVIDACRGSDRRPCYHEKFNGLSWVTQKERIRDAIEETRAKPGVTSCTVLVDSTGVGDPIVDELEAMGLDVVGVKFTSTWKEQAVKLLAADLEHGEAFILEEQREEFESYEFTMTDAGKYKFEAATGHDDEVSAKLLTHWGVHHEGPPTVHVLEQAREPEDAEDDAVFHVEPGGGKADSVLDIMNRPEAWH